MSTTYDPDNQLAPIPPLGWNSYNAFGGMHGLPSDADPRLPGGVALQERIVLETAQAMVDHGLRDAGYVYVNLDDRWQDPVTPREPSGAIRYDRRRFPHGIRHVADRVHEMGLRFGIYTVANLLACGGEEGCGQHGIPTTGSLGHERVDAEVFADWGVDFLKIDWCGVDEAGNRGRAAEVFSDWNDAIAATGRPIVLSASTWGEEQEEHWAPSLTHLWRTTGDLHPAWSSIREIATLTAGSRWQSSGGPQRGWNDPDILHVGHPALTLDESWTHLTLWAMLSAPLLAGNDLRTMDEPIRSMLLNADLLEIDRDPAAPARVRSEGSWDLWSRALADGRRVHAVVNTLDVPAELPEGLRFEGTEIAWADPIELVPAHGVRVTIA